MRVKDLILKLNISFNRFENTLCANNVYYDNLSLNTKIDERRVLELFQFFSVDLKEKLEMEKINESRKRYTENIRKQENENFDKIGLFDNFFDGIYLEGKDYEHSKTFSLYMEFIEILLINYCHNVKNFDEFIGSIKFTKTIIFSSKNKKKIVYYELEKNFENLESEPLLIFDFDKFYNNIYRRYFYFYNSGLFYKTYQKNYNPFYAIILILRFESIFKNKINWHVEHEGIEKRLLNFKNGIIFDCSKDYPIYSNRSVHSKPNPFRF